MTKPSSPTTTEAIRPWEVLPRKLLASRRRGQSASSTARVTRAIRTPRFCPVGSALMRVAIAASCLTVLTITVGAARASRPTSERLPPGGPAIAYIGLVAGLGLRRRRRVRLAAAARQPHRHADDARRRRRRAERPAAVRQRPAVGARGDDRTPSRSRCCCTCCWRSRPGGSRAAPSGASPRSATSPRVAQPLRVLFSPCDGAACPSENPVLIADAPTVAGVARADPGPHGGRGRRRSRCGC